MRHEGVGSTPGASDVGRGDASGVAVVVPAAGAGNRMGGLRKAHLPLLGQPLLLHALRPFLDHPAVEAVVVAMAPEDAEEPPGWLRNLDGRIRIVSGGETRGESVRAALGALERVPAVIAVHDAARPLTDRAILDRCFAGAFAGEGAVAGWPAVDTLKEVDEEGIVRASPDRDRFWVAQTPQAFPGSVLVESYAGAARGDLAATDDAALVARSGLEIRMVEGARWNLKVTHPEDLAVAEHLLRRRRLEEG